MNKPIAKAVLSAELTYELSTTECKPWSCC